LDCAWWLRGVFGESDLDHSGLPDQIALPWPH